MPKQRGFTIKAIVCDGRKGLIQSFADIPVQMCKFHQFAIIRRHLTKKPKLKAAQELMVVVDLMKQTDKESFVGALSKEMERLNLKFVRYADDFSIYCKTKADAVKANYLVIKFLKDKLKLPINTDKSGIRRPVHLQVLGFGFIR